jgi:hypothetical protein
VFRYISGLAGLGEHFKQYIVRLRFVKDRARELIAVQLRDIDLQSAVKIKGNEE